MNMSKRQLHIDLHPVAKNSAGIDTALSTLLAEAEAKRIQKAEVITGKGSGQLKKRVLKFLQQPAVAKRYHRVEVDAKNHGRLFIHFRH